MKAVFFLSLNAALLMQREFFVHIVSDHSLAHLFRKDEYWGESHSGLSSRSVYLRQKLGVMRGYAFRLFKEYHLDKINRDFI